jgi:hypothetical protein
VNGDKVGVASYMKGDSTYKRIENKWTSSSIVEQKVYFKPISVSSNDVKKQGDTILSSLNNESNSYQKESLFVLVASDEELPLQSTLIITYNYKPSPLEGAFQQLKYLFSEPMFLSIHVPVTTRFSTTDKDTVRTDYTLITDSRFRASRVVSESSPFQVFDFVYRD